MTFLDAVNLSLAILTGTFVAFFLGVVAWGLSQWAVEDIKNRGPFFDFLAYACCPFLVLSVAIYASSNFLGWPQ